MFARRIALFCAVDKNKKMQEKKNPKQKTKAKQATHFESRVYGESEREREK